MDVGTLAEIGAKVGDVVECMADNDILEIVGERNGADEFAMKRTDGTEAFYSGDWDPWRIVSRATPKQEAAQ